MKFMPVWFLEKVQLDPSALNLVMAALPAGIAAVSVAGPLICRVLGKHCPYPCSRDDCRSIPSQPDQTRAMSPSKQHQDGGMDFCEPEQVLYNRCLEACLTWPCLLLLAVRRLLQGLLYPGCACRLPDPAQQSAVCWPAGRVPTILAMRLASNVIWCLRQLAGSSSWKIAQHAHPESFAVV